MNVIFRFPVS